MPHFVRTTGGLLQLVHGPLSAADCAVVARFARKLGLAAPQGRPDAPRASKPFPKAPPAWDLQARRPAIFDDLPR